MKVKSLVLGICAMLLVAAGCNYVKITEPPGESAAAEGLSVKKQYRWKVHDPQRPKPAVVTPGEQPGQPPSDAIVLFDGTDLSQWEKDGEPAKWKVENGYMEIAKKTGDIRTKRSFGSCQLHIEWAAPAKVKGEDQSRGNSGVYLMSNYEIQVLDSYSNETYADGQAAAIYGQSPPMVNVCRPPGKWQSFDIIFYRPIFKGDKLVKPTTITLLHNGVLVQNNFEIEGTAAWKVRAEYKRHDDKLPLVLQNHGSPVRYRNIWLRELPEEQ